MTKPYSARHSASAGPSESGCSRSAPGPEQAHRCRWPRQPPTRANGDFESSLSNWLAPPTGPRPSMNPSAPIASSTSNRTWSECLPGRPIDDAFVGNLRFPAQEIQAQIFHVPDDLGIMLRVVPVEQVGRINAAADEIVPAVDLKIKTAAFANLGKAVIGVAGLGDLADPKLDVLLVRNLVSDSKVELEVIQVRLSPLIGPPQVRIG